MCINTVNEAKRYSRGAGSLSAVKKIIQFYKFALHHLPPIVTNFDTLRLTLVCNLSAERLKLQFIIVSTVRSGDNVQSLHPSDYYHTATATTGCPDPISHNYGSYKY